MLLSNCKGIDIVHLNKKVNEYTVRIYNSLLLNTVIQIMKDLLPAVVPLDELVLVSEKE